MGIAKDSTLTGGLLRGTTGPMAKVSWGDLPQISINLGSAFQGANRGEMQDGGYGSYTLSCGVAAYGNGATLRTVARCSGIGVRVKFGTSVQQPPADLIVDGRCVEAFRTTSPTVDGLANGSWSDQEQTFEWPHPLKRTRHTIGMHIDPNPDGSTVNVLAISGWLLPRADGFRDSAPAPRKGLLTNAQTLTTTAALLGVGTDATAIALHLVSTDTAAARLVTIYREDGTTIFDTVTLPQATSATQPSVKAYQFTTGRNLTGWKVKADAASVVTISLENM